MINDFKHELVSVCVITYNSAETVCETLESIWNQTYDNLELIVSDDNSWDGTLDMVQNWLINKGGWEKRFRNCLLMNNQHNIGVAANCNRSIEVSSGVYVQEIAGDDILVSTAIEKKVEYSKENNLPVVYSRIEIFGDNISENRITSMNQKAERAYRAVDLEHDEQFREMLKDTFICGPMGGFYNRDYFINDMGGYDERFPMLEDYPFHLKYIKNNNFRILNDICVRYRQSQDSLCHSGDSRFIKSWCDFFDEVRSGYMKEYGLEEELIKESLEINRMRESIHSSERKWHLYYNVMLEWMKKKQEGKTISNVLGKYGFYSVAIYGMGEMANVLIIDLKNTDINVKYGIERDYRGKRFGKEVLSIQDKLEDVDAIIITPIFYTNEIKEDLLKKTKKPLICLDEVINRM